MRTIALLALTLGAVPLYVAPARADDTVVGGPGLAEHGYIWDRTSGVPEPPHIQASSYVIADLETGAILAAKDPHGHYRPASTLKTLTAITLIPRLDPAKEVRPSLAAVNASGSAVGLDIGWSYTVDALFHGLLMQSGNDTAIALCEANGGLQPTLDQMNAEARRIRALDTVARTPNGLDDDPPLTLEQQHSSAYDLALIMKQGLTLPAFRKYVGAKLYDWAAPPDKKEREKGVKIAHWQFGTHDHLLVDNPYPGMIGGKNGWTSHALGSFVGAATRNGHTIIISLMHAQSDFWGDARSLLDWGFAERSKVQPAGTLVDPVPPPRPKPAAPAPAKRPHSERVPSAGRLAWWNLGAGAGGVAVLGIITGMAVFLRRRRRAAAGAPPADPSGGHVRTVSSGPAGTPPETGRFRADAYEPGDAAEPAPRLRPPGDIKVAGAPLTGEDPPSPRRTAPNAVRPSSDDDRVPGRSDGLAPDGGRPSGQDAHTGDGGPTVREDTGGVRDEGPAAPDRGPAPREDR